MELSVVVPVYNEEANVEPLIGEINGVLRQLGKSCEVIIVDDGSEDQTFAVLSKLHREQLTMKVVRLKRNFGQTAALAAGLAYARGEIVILMDGDGQNDPADIPALLAKLAEGNDLVAGWRFNRQHPFLNLRLPAKNLKLYGEMHRFIPAIAFERGARIAELKVNHRPRLRGQSKYGITRTLRVVLDLLTVKFMISYSTRPSHVFGPIGILSGVGGFLIAIYLTIQKWVYDLAIGGRPLLFFAILLVFIGFSFWKMGSCGGV